MALIITKSADDDNGDDNDDGDNDGDDDDDNDGDDADGDGDGGGDDDGGGDGEGARSPPTKTPTVLRAEWFGSRGPHRSRSRAGSKWKLILESREETTY